MAPSLDTLKKLSGFHTEETETISHGSKKTCEISNAAEESRTSRCHPEGRTERLFKETDDLELQAHRKPRRSFCDS